MDFWNCEKSEKVFCFAQREQGARQDTSLKCGVLVRRTRTGCAGRVCRSLPKHHRKILVQVVRRYPIRYFIGSVTHPPAVFENRKPLQLGRWLRHFLVVVRLGLGRGLPGSTVRRDSIRVQGRE